MEAVSKYGYRWDTETRPRILRRAGGVFEGGRYIGGACCERCGIADHFISIWEPVSDIDVAHLDGDLTNDVSENLAALCRLCHRAHDYRVWSFQFTTWLHAEHQRRIDEADAARPLLKFLKEAV
jgi:hypothetical protein